MILRYFRDRPSSTNPALAAARREGVVLRGLGQYYMARRELCPDNTVVLGYASLKDRDIPALVQSLRRAWGR